MTMELPIAFTGALDQTLESIYALGKVFEPTVVLGELNSTDCLVLPQSRLTTV